MEKIEIKGINYRLNEETLTAEVIEQENGYEGDIIIPETVVFQEVAYRVTSIRWKAFLGCKSLTSIVIPDSVTSIGENAFRGCSSLTSIVIGNSVTSIGKRAFFQCKSLKSITIPASVTCIGEVPGSYDPVRGVLEEVRALQVECPSLTEIIVAEGNTVYDSRENCNALIHTATNTLVWGCQNTIIPDSVKCIGSEAFAQCKNLTSIVIPNGVEKIEYLAFEECVNLTSVTIPDSVTSIGNGAFRGCSSLTTIVIPDGVTSIGGSAFSHCSSLSSIVIPNSVTSIEKSAFYGCDRLEQMPIMEVEIDNLIYRLLFHNQLAMRVGYSDAPETIVIPSEITHEGVQYRVTMDTKAIFEDCKSLKSVTILDGVTSIADWAFHGCESLESITIPASVTSIGYRPFEMRFSLGELTEPSKLASIVVAEGNTVYDSRENCNALIHTATNTLLYGCQNTIIPNGVTSIGDFAFCYCSLTSIVIPNSVTSIGMRAFWNCDSLKSITIPDGVKSIRKQAFCGCDSLTKVIIPASVTSIEEEAFDECNKLRTIRYGGTIAQWKEIAHYRSVVFCPTRVVRCTDGDAKL